MSNRSKSGLIREGLINRVYFCEKLQMKNCKELPKVSFRAEGPSQGYAIRGAARSVASLRRDRGRRKARWLSTAPADEAEGVAWAGAR